MKTTAWCAGAHWESWVGDTCLSRERHQNWDAHTEAATVQQRVFARESME